MPLNSFTELSTVFARRTRRAFLLVLVLVCGAAVGEGTLPPDLVERAAAGDPWAQLNLGAAYDHGLGGLPRDPARAVTWYRRAAHGGIAEARFNLAHCLATGDGVTRDEAAARHWMLLAAGQGLVDAQFLAGVMLLDGIGGEVDRERGRHWLRRAAAGGSADAAALLAKPAGAVPAD